MDRLLPLRSPYLSKSDLVGTTDFLLLASGSEICLTPLLFQGAVSSASIGCAVTFIRPSTLSTMPPGVHGMPHPDPALLRNLKMLYMDSVVELIDYFSSIHQMAALPEAILVEDLHHYIKQMGDSDPERGIARLSALMLDAIKFISSKSPDASPCLVVSTHDVNQGHLRLYQRFLRNVYVIKKAVGEAGEGQEMFKVTRFTGDEQDSPHQSETLTYTKEGNWIFLKDVQAKSAENT